jgi:predicted nuclease of predicted toxin-antitoxin system
MKLLFDHNLSPRLVNRMADIFPDLNHVDNLGLAQADDRDVWAYAQKVVFPLKLFGLEGEIVLHQKLK